MSFTPGPGPDTVYLFMTLMMQNEEREREHASRRRRVTADARHPRKTRRRLSFLRELLAKRSSAIKAA
jgi:hypothetical protein